MFSKGTGAVAKTGRDPQQHASMCQLEFTATGVSPVLGGLYFRHWLAPADPTRGNVRFDGRAGGGLERIPPVGLSPVHWS